MATDQPKSTSTPEQPAAFPPHFISGTVPPPPGYPPFFAYPPPAEGQQSDSNGAHAPPYPVMYPPGMFYAFPPPPQTSPASAPAVAPRPKRKQVKMACTNCATASKRCDEGRPCQRCRKYGTADTCVDGQRKERKKGVKRGPYKRKNKLHQTIDSAYGGGSGEASPEGSSEWPPQGTPPNATAAAIYAVAAGFPHEGYYPVFYPQPGVYPLPEGQPAPDGNAAPANGQPPPPVMPFYISGFPPFPYPPPPGAVFQFPPPGAVPPPAASAAQPAPANSTEAEQQPAEEKKDDEATCVNPAELSDTAGTHPSPVGGEEEGGSSEKRLTPAEGEVNNDDDHNGSETQD
ncbi:hypothetical protein K435DRAFT_772713 [Dendrothele bispora CBS 962.96]|uniref:Transcription activator of gluconeogenesis ERT1 n=1 Tax=Dendrothele bispora (strain CBS 962.96) TaxID=1314807 RepID=A0A4V4HIN8_DENBC|nr:hypothetical protein K435DRAFT_772713 [Dendrothele bispora CBS 962.96]